MKAPYIIIYLCSIIIALVTGIKITYDTDTRNALKKYSNIMQSARQRNMELVRAAWTNGYVHGYTKCINGSTFADNYKRDSIEFEKILK